MLYAAKSLNCSPLELVPEDERVPAYWLLAGVTFGQFQEWTAAKAAKTR